MASILRLLARIAITPKLTDTITNMTIMIATQNPIDIASRRNSKVFVAYIIVLIVTAVIVAGFTWLTWDSGNKVQDAIRKDGDVRIEEAKKGVAKIEGENLKLIGILEQEKGKVAGLETDAANAKSAQQRVEIDLRKQEERAAKAEKDLLELKEKIKWRHIDLGQRKKLVAALTSVPIKGIVDIISVAGDAEGFAFAGEIDSILKESGWTTTGVSQGIFGPSNPRGIELRVQDVRRAPAYAGFLQQKLTDAGISLVAGQNPTVAEGSVVLVIGTKP
jgi:hypothetical protein